MWGIPSGLPWFSLEFAGEHCKLTRLDESRIDKTQQHTSDRLG
jgi:hypothetical protein